jgi:hypothetical protein
MPSASKPADPAPSVYVTANRASKLTGISRARIAALAVAGSVRFRLVPGSYTRYCLQDLERIKSQDDQDPPRPATAPGRKGVGHAG